MTEQPRNWDKELADIDRVIEKQGTGASPRPGSPAPPPAAGPPGRVAVAVSPAVGRRSAAITWFWTVLAVVLAAALPLWPYDRACGLQLFFYLGATTLALLAGIAGAVSAWQTRSGVAQLLSLLVVLCSGAMGAREVLPRTGYAAQSKAWLCPAAPEPAPPAEQAQPPGEQAQPPGEQAQPPAPGT
jgi:hypothetical protein